MKYSMMLLIAAAYLTGCSSVSVTRDYDRAVDFSALHTYAWQHEKQPQTGNPRIDNDLVDQRIREAVEANLASKGYAPNGESDADFLIAYFIDYKQRIGGNTWSFGLGSYRQHGYGGVGYNTTISDYDEGRMTIDIIDPKADKMIWRGVGIRATYESSKPEKISRIINHAVGRILKDFPPKQ